MTELSFEYWNALVSQLIVISSLLCGFSLSLLFKLPDTQSNNRINTYIFRSTTIATASFLVCIFAMTKILMMTNKGFPFKVTAADLTLPRIIGVLSFLTGIVSIILIISLSGWNKPDRSKWFTIIIGILTLLLIIAMLS